MEYSKYTEFSGSDFGKKAGKAMESMEVKQTNWEELGISNDFLFGKVMQNPELCKELLQRILPKLDIDHVEYPELQKTIKEDYDAKGVRLDVYVNDGKGTVYDIEMQAVTSIHLPRRTRYYHYPNHYKIQTFSLNAVL